MALVVGNKVFQIVLKRKFLIWSIIWSIVFFLIWKKVITDVKHIIIKYWTITLTSWSIFYRYSLCLEAHNFLKVNFLKVPKSLNLSFEILILLNLVLFLVSYSFVSRYCNIYNYCCLLHFINNSNTYLVSFPQWYCHIAYPCPILACG